MNSRWARRTKALFSVRRSRPGAEGARIRRWCQAAPRAARRRPWRRSCASAQREPIPAAPSASPRLSPASLASSQPMAVARGGASWRLRHRSIRPGRSRAQYAMPRSCSPRWQGTIRRIRHRLICPFPTTKRPSADRSSERNREAVGGRRAVARFCRRRLGHGLAAAYQICFAGLLHRGAGGGILQSRPL